MKIAFTGSIFFNQKIGGISRYYVNLVSQLNLNNVDAKIFAPLNKNLYLKELHKKYKTSNYLSRFPESKILYFINESLSNLCINSSKPDIVHETYYSKNIEKLKGYKKVVTIYDFMRIIQNLKLMKKIIQSNLQIILYVFQKKRSKTL